MKLAYLLVLLGVAMISYSGPLVKSALLAGATPVTIACGRMLLSAVMLAVIACVPERGTGRRPIGSLRHLTRTQWAWSLLGSVFLAFHYYTWMTSLNTTSTFASVALVCTQPLFVALLSGLLLGEPMPRACIPGALIAVIGTVVIALSGLNGSDGGSLRGDLLALAGAALMAGHWMCGRYARRSIAATPYSLLIYAQTGLILLVLSAFTGGLQLPREAVWQIVLLAAGCTICGHFVITIAIGRVSATVVSFAILGEPVGAMFFSMWMFGEVPSPLLLTGGLIVLLGLVLYTAAQIRSDLKKPDPPKPSR